MELGACLQEQLDALLGFTELLLLERGTLSTGEVDGEALAAIAGSKQRDLATVAAHEQRRLEVQIRLGFGAEPDGAGQAARAAGCLNLWHRVQAAAQEGALGNRINGDLIHQRLEHNQRMLNLIEQVAGKSLYGPDGQPHRPSRRISSRA